MFSGQFYEKRLSARERNMKLLLESVTYIAIKESLYKQKLSQVEMAPVWDSFICNKEITQTSKH